MLKSLRISDTKVQDEVLECILRGGLDRTTTLYLRRVQCSFSTIVSMVLAFSNLQCLSILNLTIVLSEASSGYPALLRPPPRRPLDSLLVFLAGSANGEVAEALANCGFASRSLTLEAQPQNIRKLLVPSSVTVVELELLGVSSFFVYCKSNS